MSLGSSVRRFGFWAADRVKGGPIRQQHEDVKSRMASVSEASDDWSDERLQGLIDHATRTTQFYSGIDGRDLQALPVVTRSAYKDQFNEFQSSRYKGAELHHMTTSGTSGRPLEVVQDMTKRHRAIADVIYFNGISGQQVGDRLLWLKTWQQGRKSRLKLLTQNIIPYKTMGMDDAVKEDIVRTLRHQHVNGILGLPSSIWSLTRFIEEKGYRADDFRLRVIILSAEMLAPTIKARIETAFGCPVVDRYANEECGILASTKPGADRFYLNRASYHFEFLKLDADEPETAGNLARVVLTDLYNLAMPIIRYDTGDLAIVADSVQGQAITLRSIEGRRVDLIYDTAGVEMSAASVAGIMQKFHDIAQYQLVQEDASSYHLRVEVGESTRSAGDFAERLSASLGQDADVTVEFVDSIPSEPNGKFKTVIGRYVPADSPPRVAS